MAPMPELPMKRSEVTRPDIRRGSLFEPSIVEVVGPPGTGKSTVVEALLNLGDSRVRRVQLREEATIPLLIKNLVLALRPFAHRCRRMGKRRWNRLSLMVRLQTLGDLLDRVDAGESRVVLLDQGPVYMMSILQRALPAGGDPQTGDDVFEAYWQRLVASWARRLDHVVVLDAPDDLLYKRILDRPTEHLVTRKNPREASDVFRRSRESTEMILAELGAHPRPPAILRLSTDEQTLADTSRRVVEHIGGWPSEGCK